MAKVEIQSAFVEPWNRNQEAHPAWGMKTAETHSRKREDGSRETTGRTFRTVKVSRASGIDLTQFGKGDRVKVVGTEQTEVREHEGKKYYDLIVWADSVEVVQSGNGGSNSGNPNAGSQQWGNAPQMSEPQPFGGGFDDEQPF